MMELLGGSASYNSRALLDAVTPGSCVVTSAVALLYCNSKLRPVSGVKLGAKERWKVRGLGMREVHNVLFELQKMTFCESAE